MSLFEQKNGEMVYPLVLNKNNLSSIGGEELLLPRVQKGDAYLAWLDPSNPEVQRVCVPILARLVVDIIRKSGLPLNILLLTPPSGKSATMMELVFIEVKKFLPELNIEFFNLFDRDADKSKLEDRLGFGAIIIEYKPITKPKPWYIGVSLEGTKKIKQYHDNGFLPLIIDDVFSFGKTTEAMRKLTLLAFDRQLDVETTDAELKAIVAVVIARELALEEFENVDLYDERNNVYAAGKIPVEPIK